MSVGFRNVEGSPEQPVAQWPYEALVATIERGTLSDWLPITRAIKAAPRGTSRARSRSTSPTRPPYGVGPLLRRTIDDARAEHERDERREVAARVRAAVDRSGLNRADFARAIGTSRTRLSTYCTGKVVPSAALLVRMERIAGEHGARRA